MLMILVFPSYLTVASWELASWARASGAGGFFVQSQGLESFKLTFAGGLQHDELPGAAFSACLPFFAALAVASAAFLSDSFADLSFFSVASLTFFSPSSLAFSTYLSAASLAALPSSPPLPPVAIEVIAFFRPPISPAKLSRVTSSPFLGASPQAEGPPAPAAAAASFFA